MTKLGTAMHAESERAWDALRQELDAWGGAGRRATLWWRDDDARRPGPRLDRLLALASGLPLALAVVPFGTGPALAERVSGQPRVAVLQHGYAHRNHAPAPVKRMELGAHRPSGQVLDQIAAGRAKLATLFGERFTAVLAPPWNRIDRTVAVGLGRAGIRALSGFGQRRLPLALPQVNAHLDIIDWRGTRGFIGEAAALGVLVRHLGMRRTGALDGATPSGLLTHHRDNDAAAWRFLERLVEHTRRHRAVRWIGIHDAL